MRLLLALLVGVLVSAGIVLPAARAEAAPVSTFVFDASAGTLEQDQLAATLTTAARTGTAVRLRAGRLVVQRTMWLPPHATLRLDPGATITGSVPGQSLVRLQSGSRLVGGTVANRASTDCFDVDLAAGARGAVVDGTTFRGARANAVYVDAPDIRALSIRNSAFLGTVYGVLVNPGSLRATGLRIEGNTFVRTTGDAVEINTPIDAVANRVRDVVVAHNTVRAMRGSGSSSGFGVGLAGVRGFRITGNRFLGVRNEAVHLEDRSRDGVVSGNLVQGGGERGLSAIAVYRTVDSVLIQANAISGFTGGGIAVLWDAIGSSTRITIERNLIRDVTQDGVVVGGDRGTGPFVVRDNAVAGARLGVVLLGDHARSVATGNLVRRVQGDPVRTGFTGSGTRHITGNGPMTDRTRASVVGASVLARLRSES